ncbi:MAG: family 43 glycosylhydrolase [Chitinispirillaceae bacterium]|nr:family 43 glycosylhydrolase [Chitinispirillaceae bacterium]
MRPKAEAGFKIGVRGIVVVIFALMLVYPAGVIAENPCIPGSISTADPAPSVFNDTLYLYCTQDNNADLQIFNIRCWSTTDMVNWTSHGVALTENNVPWSNRSGCLWAPTVVYFGGKYHLYFPAKWTTNGRFYNGHATADRPQGPFTADAQPMMIAGSRTGSVQDDGLDPYVIMDTGAGSTNTNYLAWCKTGRTPNFNYIGALNAAGDQVTGTVTTLVNSQFYPDGQHYVEGQWWIKPTGSNLWYHIYAAYYPGGAEQCGCATASDLKGPYTFRGWLMGTNRASAAGTLHPGCVYFKNKWHLFWHCGGDEYGGTLLSASYLRSTGAEYFQFSGTNLVSPITPTRNWSIPKTYRGVGVPKVGDTIHVDRCSHTGTGNAINGVGIARVDGGEPLGHMVTDIGNNGWVRYDSVDFSRAGRVIARYASTNASNSMQIRVGSNTGTLLATVPLASTGGLTTWRTTDEVAMSATQTGVQNLVCVFTGSARTMKLNWIKFIATTDVKDGSAISPASKAMVSYKRLNKTTFQIALDQTSKTPQIRLFNMRGQEVAGAVTSKLVDQGVQVSINDKTLSSGSYVLMVKNSNGAQEIPFVY